MEPETRTNPVPALLGRPAARWMVWSALALAVFAVYANGLGNAYVFDSTSALAPDTLAVDWAQPDTWLIDHSRWLLHLSFVAQFAIHGDWPVGFRLVNVAIHAAAAVTLFELIRLLLTAGAARGLPDGMRAAGAATAVSASVALLWALHPLNTQAVTYTVQRAESAMGLCLLFTLYAAARSCAASAGGPRWAWTLASIAICLVGGGFKEIIIVAPLLVGAMHWTFFASPAASGSSRPVASSAVLYAGLTGCSAWVYLNAGAAAITDAGSAGFAFAGEALTPYRYLITQFGVVLHYLRLSLVPQPLVLDYAWPPAVPFDTPPDRVWGLYLANVIPQALAVLTMVGGSVVGVAMRRWWGLCGLAFFLVLAPTSSILPIADLAVEHRVYISLAGVIAIFVGLAVWLLLRWRTHRPTAPVRPVAVGVLVLLSLSFAAMTIARNTDYRTRIALWEQTVYHRPANARAWVNLGIALRDADRRDEAMAVYQQALTLAPNHAGAHNGIGSLLLDANRPDEALPWLRRAAELAPSEPRYHANLGAALVALDRHDDAEAALNEAIALDPRHAGALNTLGTLRAREGRLDEAIDLFGRAVEADRDLVLAYRNLVAALVQRGRLAEASAVAADSVDALRRTGASAGQINEARVAAQRIAEAAGNPGSH